MTKPYVFLDDRVAGTQRFYDAPARRITAHHRDEVAACFADMVRCIDDGMHLAGFASYELGYTLEPKLASLLPTDRSTPLLDFGVFKNVENRGLETPEISGDCSIGRLTPFWSQEGYVARFHKVMAYIEAGDVYQINLTFPMTGDLRGDAPTLYEFLRKRQPVRYGGIVCLDEPTIVTLSPELFFDVDGRTIRVRPMKGTAKRGDTAEEDAAIARDMQRDEKSRAENLMIVDLLRNDLGRVSDIGSVEVTDLYTVETFPTLHQMTSGIRAHLHDGVDIAKLFHSLFPCGSVTGAPKIRAMEIIRDIETGPRGAYCGAIGYIDPSGRACFNVAIRTLSIFGGQKVVYNVGSAIVSDSCAQSEYQECLLKAKIMTMNDEEKMSLERIPT